MCKYRKLMSAVSFIAIFILSIGQSFAENIDPNQDSSQYAWGENIGWVNFEPNVAGPNVGAQVGEYKVTGFIWAQNIGWINLDPNDSDPNTGVKNDATGNLSGYAWAENVGWINFDPNVPGDSNDYGVKIDIDGNFSGYAWGENIGWLNFNDTDLFGYGVKACKVNYIDLGNFIAQ